MSDITDNTSSPGSSLLPRAIAAFFLLPGVIAFVVPLLIARFTAHPARFARAGLLELALGLLILVECTRQFYINGRGTLAPWSPPKALVRTGLYNWSRNAMYIGVLLIVIGWALGFNSSMLWIYAGLLAVAFHLRVVLGEEPYLARTFGDEWTEYRKRVPRWFI